MVIKVILGALVVTVIGLVVFKAIDPSLNNGGNNDSSLIDDGIEEENKISVGISGEITRAGNYVLDEGASMADLIEAAGGVTTNADERCYYFEAVLTENESYYIPPKFEVDDVCGNTKLIKWNINTCTKDDLKNIDGIGDSIAQSIITHRAEHGSFYRLEDVMDVNGIGNATFSKLKNYIRLKEAN